MWEASCWLLWLQNISQNISPLLSSAASTCGRESVCVDVSVYENDHVAVR